MTIDNPWISGPFAPVAEETTAVNLEVIGTIPADLDGRYLRNGPNPITPIDPANHHWFIGDAMVHGISLRDGTAEWYRSRFVRSAAVSKVLGVDPAPGEPHLGMDLANTNVVALGGVPHAVAEAGARPVELGEHLESLCISDLGGTLPNGYTAHPKVDPVTGLTHAVAYCWAFPELQYLVIDQAGRVVHSTTIEVADGPMVHDCAITENHLVVFDMSVTFSMEAAAAGASFPYRWNDEHPSRIGLVPLCGEGSQIRWFDVDPGYVFHPLNAFEEDGEIVLDVVRYDRIFDRFPLGPADSAPAWWRWSIDLDSAAVTQRQIDDRGVEFPRVDERLVGRRATVGYGTGVTVRDGSVSIGTQSVVFDLARERLLTFDLRDDLVAGEWIMVPSAESRGETDGYLMTFGFNRSSERGELLILNAAAPDAGFVARVLLPERLPIGFHGNWFAR